MTVTRIEANIPGETPYTIRIGDALLGTLGDDCRKTNAVTGSPKAVIVTDSHVAPLYLSAIKDSLSSAGYQSFDIAVEAGEESKSVDVVSELWNAFAILGISRDS